MNSRVSAKHTISLGLATMFAILPGLQGCFSGPANPGRVASSSFNLNSVPQLPVVDASQLRVTDIVVAQLADPRTGGTRQPVLDFRYSGSTDYIEAKTCIEATGACNESKNIFENKGTLANAPDGSRVLVQLRACVNPERSKGSSNCGPWYSQEYTQWVSEDKEKSLLQQEFEAIERDVKDLEKKLKEVLKLREERAEKCKPATQGEKDLLDAERGLVQAITRLGGGIVGAIGKKLTERPPAKVPSDTQTPVDPLEPPVYALSQGLAPSGANSSREIIVAQEPRHVRKIFEVMALALSQKSAALKIIAREKKHSFNISSAETNPKPPAEGSPGSDREENKKPGAAAENAAVAITNANSSGAVKWDVIIESLPTLADAIFDLSNADRAVALKGICVDKLGEKLEEAIKLANEEAERAIIQLHSRAQRVRAKLGAKP